MPPNRRRRTTGRNAVSEVTAVTKPSPEAASVLPSEKQVPSPLPSPPSSPTKTKVHASRKEPPIHRWIGKGQIQADGSVVYEAIEVLVAGKASIIRVGDSALLYSGNGEDEDDEDEDSSAAGGMYMGALPPSDDENERDVLIDEKEDKFYYGAHTDYDFRSVSSLDPFVARIVKMWEEPASGSGKKGNKKRRSSVGEGTLVDPGEKYDSERKLRMKIRARWYFKKEDIAGMNGYFTGTTKKGLLNVMCARDLVLGNHTDDNEVPTLLGRCRVARRRPLKRGKSKEAPKDDIPVPKNAYVCRYDARIPKVGESQFGSVIIESYKDEPTDDDVPAADRIRTQELEREARERAQQLRSAAMPRRGLKRKQTAEAAQLEKRASSTTNVATEPKTSVLPAFEASLKQKASDEVLVPEVALKARTERALRRSVSDKVITEVKVSMDFAAKGENEKLSLVDAVEMTDALKLELSKKSTKKLTSPGDQPVAADSPISPKKSERPSCDDQKPSEAKSSSDEMELDQRDIDKELIDKVQTNKKEVDIQDVDMMDVDKVEIGEKNVVNKQEVGNNVVYKKQVDNEEVDENIVDKQEINKNMDDKMQVENGQVDENTVDNLEVGTGEINKHAIDQKKADKMDVDDQVADDKESSVTEQRQSQVGENKSESPEEPQSNVNNESLDTIKTVNGKTDTPPENTEVDDIADITNVLSFEKDSEQKEPSVNVPIQSDSVGTVEEDKSGKVVETAKSKEKEQIVDVVENEDSNQDGKDKNAQPEEDLKQFVVASSEEAVPGPSPSNETESDNVEDASNLQKEAKIDLSTEQLDDATSELSSKQEESTLDIFDKEKDATDEEASKKLDGDDDQEVNKMDADDDQDIKQKESTVEASDKQKDANVEDSTTVAEPDSHTETTAIQASEPESVKESKENEAAASTDKLSSDENTAHNGETPTSESVQLVEPEVSNLIETKTLQTETEAQVSDNKTLEELESKDVNHDDLKPAKGAPQNSEHSVELMDVEETTKDKNASGSDSLLDAALESKQSPESHHQIKESIDTKQHKEDSCTKETERSDDDTSEDKEVEMKSFAMEAIDEEHEEEEKMEVEDDENQESARVDKIEATETQDDEVSDSYSVHSTQFDTERASNMDDHDDEENAEENVEHDEEATNDKAKETQFLPGSPTRKQAGIIHVGEAHQAEIPPLSSVVDRANYKVKFPATHVWSPGKIDSYQVSTYLAEARVILKKFISKEDGGYEFEDDSTSPFYKTNIETPPIPSPLPVLKKVLARECNGDELLDELHRCNYDSEAALAKIKKNPKRYLTLWSQEEREKFELGFSRHCGLLRTIAKLIPTKNCKEVVDFHYRFKIPHQFRKYEEQKKMQARRMMAAADLKLLEKASAGQQMKKSGRNWTKGGATEARRVMAKDFLIQTRDRIGAEKYLQIANLLKDYHAKGITLADLKTSILGILEGDRDLVVRFIDFLPKKIRASS